MRGRGIRHYFTLLTNILKTCNIRYCAVARGMVNQIEDILHLSKVVKNKNLQ